MFRGVVAVAVYAHDDRDVFAFGGSGDENFLCAAGDVLACIGRAGESAGGLEHDVHSKLAPRELARIAMCKHANLIAIDRQAGTIGGDVAAVGPVNGIVLEQMSEGPRIGEVVHRHKIELRRSDSCGSLLFRRTQNLPANSPESIDPNTYCHVNSYGGSRSPPPAARPTVT